MKRLIGILFIITVFALTGCGGAGQVSSSSSNEVSSSSGTSDSLVASAVKSLPFIEENGLSDTAAAIIVPAEEIDSESSEETEESDKAELIENASSFFKAECHNDDGSVNLCKDGEELTLDNKFTTTTLVGLLYHAEMKFNDVFSENSTLHQECLIGDANEEIAGKTLTFSPIDSDAFIIDMPLIHDCLSKNINGDEVTHNLYSRSLDKKIFGAVSTRREHTTEHDYTGVMSDIFQTYLRKNASGEPLIGAFNLASYDAKDSDDYNARALLIVNMQDHKFVVKYRSGDTDIAAIGVAGYDSESESWIEGYYEVDLIYDGEVFDSACIANGETNLIANSSFCSEFSKYLDVDNWTTEDLYDWIGMNSDDKKNLSGIDRFFENELPISDDDMPQDGTSRFPEDISAE